MATKSIKLSELPETVTEEGVKIYGSASYETQVAILSHYLHALDGKHDIASGEKRNEILGVIRDYLEFKKRNDKSHDWKGYNEEEIASMVAEDSPLQYDLFSEFFDVPFPAPDNPKFTFIDLFAGIGGFRIAMQELGGKCVYSSEFDAQAQRTYKTILEHLDDAGYDVVPPQIVNAMDFGVPQHRKRVYIIGFRKDLHIDISKFQYPEPQTTGDKRPRLLYDIKQAA